MQGPLRPLVPTIEVTTQEHAFLRSERLRAQSEALRLMGYEEGHTPRLGVDPTAQLIGLHRGRDGVLRAQIVIHKPGTSQRYRRNIAAPLPRSPGTASWVSLRRS